MLIKYPNSRFLTKSYEDLRQQFSHITPLYPLIDFLRDYAEVLNIKCEMRNESLANELIVSDQIISEVCQRIEKSLGHHAIDDKLQVFITDYKNLKTLFFPLIYAIVF